LLKEHSRDPCLCALLQTMVGVQERYGFRVVVGPHVDAVHGGSRTGPDGLSRGVLPEQCLPQRPGGDGEGHGVWHWVQQAACDALGRVHGSREARSAQQRFSGGCPQSCLSLDA
jgi:hypothetical protein